MKIAIDIRPIGQQRTGDEVYTLNLVQNLVKIDSDNFYFLITNTKGKSSLTNIKNKIFGENKDIPNNFKIVSITPSSKLLWTFFLLPLWVKKNNVDILHVQYITPLILLGKTKLITTIHDVSFDAYPEFIKKSDLLFLKILIPLSIKRSDKVISVSNFTKNEIIKYHKTSPEKIHTIYNGNVAKNFFKKTSNLKRNKVINKYQLEKPFIFHIGTLQPRKNIPFLLKSFRLFHEKYASNNPNTSKLNLYLTGDPEKYNFDKKISKTLDQIKKESPKVFNKIKFLGYVNETDLPIILGMAEIIALTSLYEGFGLPAIEAISSGVPLVSNNKSSLGEVIGDAAFFYDQDNEKSLAKNIFKAIINKELRQDFVKKGLKRSQEFSWEKCARETLTLYNSQYSKNK